MCGGVIGVVFLRAGDSGLARLPWQTLNLNQRLRVMSSCVAHPERYDRRAPDWGGAPRVAQLFPTAI
ncbi:MAG: hypothetical protein EBU23_11345 [Mycobacteriaceae bacterium]|nr:hypothetical protein [Mycobacterium sp.]NBP85849.1 hypothetical protein [Mycobacteriaceae bacterium]NBQ43064.1 hypothetical protein [Mycobacteriaceae bacterium]